MSKIGKIICFINCVLICSCNIQILNKEGDKYIEDLDKNNKCWEIIVNQLNTSNLKTGETGTEIIVHIRGCSGILSIDSVEKDPGIIQKIADDVLKYCIDIKGYSGVTIDCSVDSQDSYSKRFEFDIQNGKAVLRESSTMDKL